MAKNDILETLLQRAEQKEEDRIKSFSIKSKALGDEVTVIVPPLKKLLDLIDSGQDAESTADGLEANAEVVYESIPVLKENYKALSEAYDEKDVAVLTIKIFNAADAVGEISDIAEKIMDSRGIFAKTVKN